MKVFISADIEGVAGITDWSEASKSSNEYSYFAEQMTKEVKAACNGANRAGADEIWIRDAHGSGRNIDASELPENTKLIRGWSGHPFGMVQELDKTFDAVIYIGYHAWGGSNYSPLAHTINDSRVDNIKINGEYASEFLLNSYAAAYVEVPVVFISGDKGICEHAKNINENIKTVAVSEGVGNSTISIHPDLAIELIEEGVEESLKGDLSKNKITLPEGFNLEMSYVAQGIAYESSFYPGAKLIGPKKVKFYSKDYFEILRARMFLV
ncbi:MAG TPA: M55 family metallopeptidase [Tissierellales bacterium]|nr:M55 family metallopeptidase [Tissierellales bacterium]